jgi:hypothetical protein
MYIISQVRVNCTSPIRNYLRLHGAYVTVTIMTTQVGMLWQLPSSKDEEWTAGRCEAGWESLTIMLAPTASALAYTLRP